MNSSRKACCLPLVGQGKLDKLSCLQSNSLRELDSLKSIPLSESDILNLIDDKANVLTYRELEEYDNINDALGNHKALILLYETKPNYGHWTCVFKVGKNKIQFFDSYGLFIDDEMNFVPNIFKETNYNDYRHLSKLLYNSGYKIYYNNYKLQSDSTDEQQINTCGRFVAVRLALRDLTEDQFANIFLRFDDPDLLVTYLTS